ncbi:hypothetical protein IW262DRAFT_1234250, partial [Armillaria fumosa]
AVVIGIDAYESISPLKCSVTDAQSFREYLTTKLGIPAMRIQVLLGSKQHTSSGSSNLINNPDIKKGDNIIIYYAGHGSSYQFSDYNDVKETLDDHEISPGSTGYIKALCPIDRDTFDENGDTIPDISDREFNTILMLISRVKGHHITVILNCCHSASVSR